MVTVHEAVNQSGMKENSSTFFRQQRQQQDGPGWTSLKVTSPRAQGTKWAEPPSHGGLFWFQARLRFACIGMICFAFLLTLLIAGLWLFGLLGGIQRAQFHALPVEWGERSN